MFSTIKAISNKSFIISRLQGSLLYWRSLDLYKRVKFRIDQHIYSIQQWKRDRRQSGSLLKHFTLKALSGGAIACGTVFALRVVEKNLFELDIAAPLDVDFSNFYAVLAQISGVMLGLYLTAISVVISTAYLKVSDDIRELFIHSKINDQYLSVLMLLGIISLVEFFINTLGMLPKSQIVLCISLFLVLWVFLNTPTLINFIFRFFNPAELAHNYIFPEVFYWARQATYRGLNWDDVSFQAHYYKMANQKLRTYKRILNILVSDPKPNTPAIVKLVREELRFLSFYVPLKSQIPSNSRWFQNTLEHPRWFEAQSSSVDIALEAGITLHHKEVPHHLWVEEHISQDFEVAFQCLLKQNDTDAILELMQSFQNSCSRIVRVLALKEAYFLTKIRDNLLLSSLTTAQINENNKKHLVALADFYGADHVNIPIEYGKILEQVSPEDIRKKLRKINWSKEGAIYKASFAFSLLPNLEDLAQRKISQLAIEKNIQIPEWYDLELVAVMHLRFLEETVKEVISQYTRAFTEPAKLLNETDKAIMLQIITRGIEGSHKVHTFLSMAQNLEKELKKLIGIIDIPFPEIRWSEEHEKVSTVRDNLIESFGKLAIELDPNELDKSLPDYFGHAYWIITRECFSALCDNNLDRFKNLYSLSFILFTIAWDYMNKLAALNENKDYYIAIYSEIFIDLMALGGYSKLFSEYRLDDYWTITKTLWDAVRKDKSTKDFFAPFIAAANFKSTPFTGITNRNMERSGWENRFSSIVRDELNLSDDYTYYRGIGRQEKETVPSPILRTYGTSGLYHPENVFIASYILELPDAGEIEVSIDTNTREFINSLQDTIERDNEDG